MDQKTAFIMKLKQIQKHYQAQGCTVEAEEKEGKSFISITNLDEDNVIIQIGLDRDKSEFIPGDNGKGLLHACVKVELLVAEHCSSEFAEDVSNEFHRIFEVGPLQ